MKAAYLSFYWFNDSLIREFELVTRGYELVTRGFELITCKSKFVNREFELVTRGFELVLLSYQLVTRNSELVFYHITFVWQLKLWSKYLDNWKVNCAVRSAMGLSKRNYLHNSSLRFNPMRNSLLWRTYWFYWTLFKKRQTQI